MHPLLKNKPKDGFELKRMMREITKELRLKAQAEGRIKKVYAKPSN